MAAPFLSFYSVMLEYLTCIRTEKRNLFLLYNNFIVFLTNSGKAALFSCLPPTVRFVLKRRNFRRTSLVLIP